jgi:hypothetical protein
MRRTSDSLIGSIVARTTGEGAGAGVTVVLVAGAHAKKSAAAIAEIGFSNFMLACRV